MEDVEAPKFQVGNSKPLAGGLLHPSVNEAAAKSKRRRRGRKKRRPERLITFDDEHTDETPAFNNRLHLGEKKPHRRVFSKMKAPSNAYERVSRYQKMSAGVEQQ